MWKCKREWAAKAASSSCHCSTKKREIEWEWELPKRGWFLLFYCCKSCTLPI
jgi:hypothetical protein